MRRDTFFCQHTKWSSLILFLLCLIGPVQTPLLAQDQQRDLMELSLEDLMNIEVSLASRKEEPLFGTAAAIAVLTRDDVRRSGTTTIPDALRLIPGMQVARLDANKWAITARGFNSRFASRLLVLIDGRSIYTPLFSGVVWESHDLILADIERIEVIRGPGAALWGANAVNGIINIVTRPVEKTRSDLLKIGAGSEERGFAAWRRDGEFSGYNYRFYGKYFKRDNFVDASGQQAEDDWQMGRIGWRAERTWEGGDALVAQGQIYTGERGQIFRFADSQPPYLRSVVDHGRLRGGHVQARWRRPLSASADLRLQVYYDRSSSKDVFLEEQRDTWDVDFQHHFSQGLRHEIVWGLGYRYTADQIVGSTIVSFAPDERGLHLASAFFQDEINLVDDRWRLTIGSKFEHHTYTGGEYQPSLRLRWTPAPRHVLWSAVSRAVRTPSRGESEARLFISPLPPDALFPGSPLVLPEVIGNRDFRSEGLWAWETGWRFRPRDRLLLDLAAFYNFYEKLRVPKVAQVVDRDSLLIASLTLSNLLESEARGIEMAADWRSEDEKKRLRAAYSYLHIEQHLLPGAFFPDQRPEDDSPEHQFYLWGSLDPLPRVDLDSVIRYVSSLDATAIAAYWELDVRLGWHPLDALEIALVGRNLLDAHHPEFQPLLLDTQPTETQRSFYTSLTWSF